MLKVSRPGDNVPIYDEMVKSFLVFYLAIAKAEQISAEARKGNEKMDESLAWGHYSTIADPQIVKRIRLVCAAREGRQIVRQGMADILLQLNEVP